MRGTAIAAIALLGCSFSKSAPPDPAAPDAGAASDADLPADGAAADAPSGDAIIEQIRTLQQTADDVVAPGQNFPCDGESGQEYGMTWYRAIALSDYGITETLRITSVSFGVQGSSASSPVAVAVGSYAGAIGGSTIDLSQVTTLASVQAAPASSGIQTVAIAATIPAGGNFVLSVAAPDEPPGGTFVIGSTIAAEDHPAYLTSTTCVIQKPETVGAAGATGSVILYATGEVP